MKAKQITNQKLIQISDSTAGTCPNCGNHIQQSTYTDYCPCGHSDCSYINY